MRIKNSSVQSILKEVNALTAKNQPLPIEDIIALIDQCVFTLESANKYMKQYSKLEDKQTALMQMKIAQLQNGNYSDVLKTQLNDISEQKLKQDTTEALIKGYTLVTKLAELVTNRSLNYTIVIAGSKGQSSTLASSTLTLEELLSDASLDFGKQGIGLSIRSSQKTIQNALAALNANGTTGNRYKTNVLSKMKSIQLTNQQSSLWEDLKMIGDAAVVETDQGKHKTKYGINYGTVIESFMDVYRNGYNGVSSGYNKIHSSYYTMLEKGRNNLAYYKGGDVEYIDSNGKKISEQIKSLTSFTSKSRFDVATLSNVLTPLTNLQTIFTNYQSNPNESVLMEALNKEFTANPGEGDRRWDDAISSEVHKFLDETFGMNYFT